MLSNLAASVGQRIRNIRKSQGLTQEDLGEKVQQPQSYIGSIERGEKNISLDTLERIATALKVRVEELIKSGSLTEKEKLVVSVQTLLKDRTEQEIKLLQRLITDVFTVLDSKNS
jgi:transcriptional regulator with XRE-family HTH domain